MDSGEVREGMRESLERVETVGWASDLVFAIIHDDSARPNGALQPLNPMFSKNIDGQA